MWLLWVNLHNASGSVCSKFPAGQCGGKAWGTGTAEFRHQDRTEPATKGWGEAWPRLSLSSILAALRKWCLPICPGIARARQQGLGAEPGASAHWLQLSSRPLFPVLSVQGRKLAPQPQAKVREGRERLGRPQGNAFGTSFCPSERRPSAQQKPEQGADGVEVVSLYRGGQAQVGDHGGLLGQHRLLHGLLQRLPRHQQAYHLL